MPKALSEYTLADWKRLRPLAHRLKTARYWLIDRRYRAQPAAVGDAAAVARPIAGRKVLFTVAYQDPQAIDWQAALVRHFVPGALYVVVDNSPQDADAKAIERVCGAHGVSYLRAPPNPWAKSSRSHGIVLNWIWHNVVRPGAPEAFGLLDHDLFPTAPDDPFAPLAKQDVYGYVRFTEPPTGRWFLWAGFTMMRFAAVRDLELDFGQDWFLGLDTGGGNWGAALQQARSRHAGAGAVALPAVPRGHRAARRPAAMVRRWLHEVGQMGEPEVMADKRRVVADVAPHLEAAKVCRADLTPSPACGRGWGEGIAIRMASARIARRARAADAGEGTAQRLTPNSIP